MLAEPHPGHEGSRQSHGAAARSSRPATIADVPALAELARAIGAAIDDEPIMTAAELTADLTRPDIDPTLDTRVVVAENDVDVLAYALAFDEARGRSNIDPLLDPSLEPEVSDAILDELLTWGIDRAAAFGERRGLERTHAFVAAARAETRMFAGAARFGFAPARTFWRMRLNLADPHPSPVGVDGVVLESVDPFSEVALGRLHALDLEAFAEHWGYVPQPFVEFATHVRAFAGLDPHATWIAVDQESGRDVGFLIGSDRVAGQGDGYVDVLGVIPEARGKGIARELLATAFAYYESRGFTGVSLGVDADNTTGAPRLYSAVGMREDQVWDVWELVLDLAAVDDEGEPDEDGDEDEVTSPVDDKASDQR